MSEILSLLRRIPSDIEDRAEKGALTDDDRKILEQLSHDGVINQAVAGLECLADYVFIANHAKHEIEDLNNVSWLIKMLSDVIDHSARTRDDAGFFLRTNLEQKLARSMPNLRTRRKGAPA